MPQIRFLQLCFSVLTLAACTSTLPQPQINTPAAAELTDLHRFSLTTSPEAEQTSALHSQLQGFLHNAMAQRGYQLAEPAEIEVQYWFDEHSAALQINIDTPAPAPLGLYQAVHRLQDVAGTLRVQLTDTQQNTLWEAQITTPLSPESDRSTLLDQAVHTLLRKLPHAKD
jgi:hypothetical protein